jgi:hypothetical protein
MRSSRVACFVMLGAALAVGCSRPRPDVPGMQLLARVEARLARERPALRAHPGHAGELFPVPQAELNAFLLQVRPHGSGADLILGTMTQPESHGGGLLRLLLDEWRPDSRPASLDDAYLFRTRPAPLRLRDLYEAHRQQLYLPVPGRAPEAIDGALPQTPQLPRMFVHFQGPYGAERIVDSDSFKQLGLLIRLEPDATRIWRNRFGQPLSLALLMRDVRAHYLASAAPTAEPADHSNLHLVGLLAEFDAATHARDLAPIQRHFLDVDLAQEQFDRDADLVLAHFAESLGHLLDATDLSWSRDDRRRVRRWLAELETRRFADVERVDLDPLCHLAYGLREVRAHRDALK